MGPSRNNGFEPSTYVTEPSPPSWPSCPVPARGQEKADRGDLGAFKTLPSISNPSSAASRGTPSTAHSSQGIPQKSTNTVPCPPPSASSAPSAPSTARSGDHPHQAVQCNPPNPAPFLATNNKPASTQRVSNSCPTLTLPVRDNSSTKQASKRYPTGQPQIFLLFFTAKSTFRPQLPRQNHQYQQHPGHQTRRIPSRLSFRHQRLGLMTDNPTGTNNSDPLRRSLRCEHVG